MTLFEINKKIVNNNKRIEELQSELSIFVLNPEINQLLNENKELRAQCTHEFENGMCKYCFTEED